MDKINEEQLKLEIAHIFDSGVNELRIFEMVKNFIDSRNGVNKNFVLADVIGSNANKCEECGKELESGTVFCSADCKIHYYR